MRNANSPPGYLDFLQEAELWSSVSDFGTQLRHSGLTGIVAIGLFVLAFGLGLGGRRTSGLALLTAILACGAGWLGSYSGYKSAEALMKTADTLPTDEEMRAAANAMAFLPIVTTIAFVLLAAWVVVVGALQEKGGLNGGTMCRVHLTCALVALLSGCATNKIIVESDLSNRPFAYIDERGLPTGIEVDLVRVIGARLNASVQWRIREFDQLLSHCANNECDLVAATIGITPEREKSVLFTRPYYRTRIALVVRNGAGEPTSREALRNRRVRASGGTTSERAVRRVLPNAILVLAGKDAATVASELESGTIDAAAMDGPDATRLVTASLGALRELEPLAEEHYAFAIAPGRKDLLSRVDIVLQELDEADVIDALLVRYGIETR